ncbi:CapA family protein [Adlercreutzia equolifaciens]|uniref:CapA family protein n=1 Tax=Adlercreutzia equolifaciens TaxID=446660 RepID=UPI0023AFA5D3|nr:CapA family protein [Adlercreutzia equolifaciens]MDE8702605.1 CapA family protein [Adlercreutzia equolifaciens]
MYVKPVCPLPVKVLIVAIIVVELVAVGFLVSSKAAAASGASEAPAETTVEQPQTQAASEPADKSAPAADEAEEKPVTLTVTFAGDCTLGTDENFDASRNFTARWEAENEDPAYFLKNVADLFGADDLTVVNMEGTLTDSTERADKQFAFKGPAEYAKILSSASVETASVANNHSADYGQQSLDDTIEALDAEGIESFGYDRICYRDVKGVKVALIGAAFPEDSDDNRKQMTDNIAKAREEGAQLVLVYVHWGIEREYTPTQDQIDMGHAAIDAGADLVVGGHPHVIQGYEVYQGRYIVYSLGNFCFGGNSNPEDKDCMIFQQTFTVTGDEVAKNDDVDFIACSVSSESDRNTYQPTLAEGDEKARIEKKIQDSTDEIAEMVAA